MSNTRLIIACNVIITLMALLAFSAITISIQKAYEQEQASHAKTIQYNEALLAEIADLQQQKRNVESQAAHTEKVLFEREEELHAAKKDLAAAQLSLVESGVFPPSDVSISRTIQVKATAYTADPAENGGTYNGKVLTRTGFSLTDNPNAKVIAVDPRVIPIGSTVWVEGYGYAKALDTGGAIKGNRIDVFINNKQQMYDWGVRSVQVMVVDEA